MQVPEHTRVKFQLLKGVNLIRNRGFNDQGAVPVDEQEALPLALVGVWLAHDALGVEWICNQFRSVLASRLRHRRPVRPAVACFPPMYQR